MLRPGRGPRRCRGFKGPPPLVRLLAWDCEHLATRALHSDTRPESGATTQRENEVQGRFFLDPVARQCVVILERLAGEDEALLVGRDTLLGGDLSLNDRNGVRFCDVECDSPAGQCLDKDLHVWCFPGLRSARVLR